MFYKRMKPTKIERLLFSRVLTLQQIMRPLFKKRNQQNKRLCLLARMKNLLAYIISVFLLISCEPVDMIYFRRNYVEVDYHAQEVILTTDANITGIGFILSESDTEEWSEHIDENYFIAKGDWFTITVDRSQRRRVSVVLQENETDKDRKVVVLADRFAGADMATVVQKAKPTE